jgi:Fe-S-cluster-containing hydrogenase component 2
MDGKESKPGVKPVALPAEKPAEGWGMENYPYPAKGVAYIECDELKCVGCGICQMACSMRHHGVINKDLSRIQVRKYLVPLPKAVQVVCVQCEPEERECEKACPLKTKAIHYDKETQHMVVDQERCLGQKCLLCMKACPAGAIRTYPAVLPKPFVCDLCDPENTGNRKPSCVDVCPYNALYYRSSLDKSGIMMHDVLRIHPDEKAELIRKRLYPMPKDCMFNPRTEAGK